MYKTSVQKEIIQYIAQQLNHVKKKKKKKTKKEKKHGSETLWTKTHFRQYVQKPWVRIHLD